MKCAVRTRPASFPRHPAAEGPASLALIGSLGLCAGLVCEVLLGGGSLLPPGNKVTSETDGVPT